jgi:hypothetical protein
MTKRDLYCWKCNHSLEDVLQLFSRMAKCKSCKCDLHVCRMCEFYDTTVSNACREPIAEKVSDKVRSNFCGYFQPVENIKTGNSEALDSNKASLESLFDLEEGSSKLSSNDADQSKQELDVLFGLNGNKKD